MPTPNNKLDIEISGEVFRTEQIVKGRVVTAFHQRFRLVDFVRIQTGGRCKNSDWWILFEFGLVEDVRIRTGGRCKNSDWWTFSVFRKHIGSRHLRLSSSNKNNRIAIKDYIDNIYKRNGRREKTKYNIRLLYLKSFPDKWNMSSTDVPPVRIQTSGTFREMVI